MRYIDTFPGDFTVAPELIQDFVQKSEVARRCFSASSIVYFITQNDGYRRLTGINRVYIKKCIRYNGPEHPKAIWSYLPAEYVGRKTIGAILAKSSDDLRAHGFSRLEEGDNRWKDAEEAYYAPRNLLCFKERAEGKYFMPYPSEADIEKICREYRVPPERKDFLEEGLVFFAKVKRRVFYLI